MVGCRALVPAVGQKTVPLVGEARSTLGNIDEMPVVRFVPLGSNLVRPVRDGCEARIADQRANPPFRVLDQAGLSQRRHDLVPSGPPAYKGRRYEQCQDNGCRDDRGTFHKGLTPTLEHSQVDAQAHSTRQIGTSRGCKCTCNL